jgi:hypothetical protein
MFEDFYGAHIKEMQRRWEAAMLEGNFSATVIHAGTPLVSFLDDYVYPFRPNPLFLAWLPLTHHHDSVLLIRPGEKPLLWFYQPEDYYTCRRGPVKGPTTSKCAWFQNQAPGEPQTALRWQRWETAPSCQQCFRRSRSIQPGW